MLKNQMKSRKPVNLRKPRPFRFFLFALALALLPFAATSIGQELPKKIRGYKVYKGEVRTGSAGKPEDGKPYVDVTFETPVLESIGPEGATFSLSGSIVANEGKGKIDLLAFNGFTVNGIPVEISDYRAGIELRSGQVIELPMPVEILVSIPSAIRAAAKEISQSEETWPVKGRVFVFGKFRKFGFSFKRVIPIDVEFTVPNPLR